MINKKEILKKLLVLCCVLTLLVPGDVLAASTGNNKEVRKADRELETIKKYLTYEGEEGDKLIFNDTLAIENNESEEIIMLGKDLEEISIIYSVENESNIDKDTKKLVVPVWGNYCGPGWGTKDSKKPTTDILDKGCKAHDNCYKGAGYKKNCTCNRNLVNHINNNLKNMSGNMLTTAKTIRNYFKTVGLIGC